MKQSQPYERSDGRGSRKESSAFGRPDVELESLRNWAMSDEAEGIREPPNPEFGVVQHWVEHILQSFGASREDAEEIADFILLEAIKQFQEKGPACPPFVIFYRISRYRWKDYKRKIARRKKRWEAFEARTVASVLGEFPNPAEILLKNEFRERVMTACMACLDENDRALLQIMLSKNAFSPRAAGLLRKDIRRIFSRLRASREVQELFASVISG